MSGAGSTVLLVCTDAAHRAQLAAMLAQHGYTLLLAGSHGDALAVMVRQVPGLLIIDLAGASQDGLALLAWLKANPGSVGIPVILLATSDRRDERLAGLAAGADAVLTLPVDGDELSLRVRNLLRLSIASPLGLTGMALQVAILDAVPANIALLDMQGVLVSVNETWRRYADANGMPGSHYAGIGSNYLAVCDASTGAEALKSHQVAAGIRAVLDGTQRTFSIEYPCHSPTRQGWYLISVAPLGDEQPVGAIVMHLDVTEKRLAEEDLRTSGYRVSELLNNIGLASVMLDEDARITFCNEFLLQLTGWRHDEVIGGDWFALFMPFDDGTGRAHFATLLANDPTALRCEFEVAKRNGERCLIGWNNSVLHGPGGEVVGSASIGEDITEQRRSARKILDLNATLEKLSVQLIQAQEQERISLARELHDELGQRLALLKFNLHQLNQFPLVPEAHALWASIDADVGTLIAQIRVISVSLRPPVLDYLGLESAIGQLLERQFASTATTCCFDYAGVPASLAPSVEIAMYRIVQECITNVVRHAEASRVVVEVNGGESGYELELIIRDNGKGFDRAALARSVRPDGSHTGLPGMEERMALLGGSLAISTAPGKGTRIVASLTLAKHE